MDVAKPTAAPAAPKSLGRMFSEEIGDDNGRRGKPDGKEETRVSSRHRNEAEWEALKEWSKYGTKADIERNREGGKKKEPRPSHQLLMPLLAYSYFSFLTRSSAPHNRRFPSLPFPTNFSIISPRSLDSTWPPLLTPQVFAMTSPPARTQPRKSMPRFVKQHRGALDGDVIIGNVNPKKMETSGDRI